jgi:adenylosuccinate synthase
VVVITADVIVDLQYGDSGKGKVAHILAHKKKYQYVLRYNGGGNAGHTIYHKGVKFVTHQVPVGVFYGIPSIIGPGCVVNIAGLLDEIAALTAAGIKVAGKLFVAKNAHVVTTAHLNEEGGEKKIGTTKQGIGPAYRDKHARVGVRAESVPELAPYLVDLYELFHETKKAVHILCEGAQGFGLDIDWGDYPFVTSSHCTTAGALLNGIPPRSLREVWGIAKAYETYVGSKDFEPKDPIFPKLRELGEEFGATTGRPRQCNWLNLDMLEKAIRMNGVTHVVINKCDILRAAGRYALYAKGKEKTFKTEAAFKTFVAAKMKTLGIAKSRLYFSERKDAL